MKGETSRILKDSSQTILSLWETEVRKKIPAAKFESRVSLRDSIPHFLNDLILALDSNFSEHSEDFLRFAHKHGRERANDSHYTIEDAITEYNILRKVIFSVLEAKGEISSRERDIIYEAISLALAKAGAEYAKTQIKEVETLNTRLHAALETADIGLFAHEFDTDMIEWSEKEASIFGVDPSRLELPFEEMKKIFHPEDMPVILKGIQDCLDNKKEKFKEQFRLIHPDGSIHWVIGVGKPLRDENGKISHIIGTHFDITESKFSRDTINNLANRLKLITDIQPTLIVYLDQDMNFLFANQTFFEWFHIHPDTIIGKNIRDVAPGEVFDDLKDQFQESLQGKTVRFQQYINYPSGKKFVDATYKPHLDESGNVLGIFVSVDDVTEVKQKIDELRKEQDLRDKFVSTLSHDLRTPLTASKMSAQIIARKITDSAIQTHTTRIVDNINRADKLIQDLLDASKIRAGKMSLPATEEFDVVQLIHTTLDDLTTIHGERFIFKGPHKLEVNLHQDGIRRILENLCSNAIKYGSTHDPIKVIIGTQGDHFALSVCNTGNPLIHIDRDKLFEPFEQFHGSGKSGWGIGLTIVKGITEAHGGSVHVESDSNTTFTVNLPINAAPFIENHLH